MTELSQLIDAPADEVIINLHGGLLQDAFCSVPAVQVLVADWDVEGSFPGEPVIVDVPLAARKETRSRGDAGSHSDSGMGVGTLRTCRHCSKRA